MTSGQGHGQGHHQLAKDFHINVSNKFICDHHICKYVTRYTSRQRKYCNCFNNHSKSVVNNLIMISADKCEKFRNITKINLDPGNKYCKNCEFKITSIIKNSEKENALNDGLNVNNDQQFSSNSQVSSSSQLCTSDSSEDISLSQGFQRLNKILAGFNEPPLKREKLNDDRLKNKTYSILESMNSKFVETVNKRLNIYLPTSINVQSCKRIVCHFKE